MRIVFMGTPESAEPSLSRLLDDGHEIVAVWTQPDKPAGRGKKLHQSPIKNFALAHKLAVHQPAKIRNQEAIGLFVSHHVDAAIVVAYGKILPPEFIDAPKQGCLNLHFSLLPKYRGAAPVNWAIVNGESETGVTTMKIVCELDAGPILLQRSIPIEADDTAPALMSRLAETGAELLSETLRNLHHIEARPQPHERATFAPIIKREDGLIDWSMNAVAIERRVRGFQPWPNAYTTCGSKRLIIWKAKAEQSEDGNSSTAEVIEARGDRLSISCGNSTRLIVLEAQIEGGRRIGARDLINGNYLPAGLHLGR